ncbi:MAG: metallophosphoesterase [Deltaproteobacteria bacterium]|nr:metallophosphoesterase [Deltaproteobacteria bacterium]MBW2595849.1 metallophosphoesterase [Deltaproteobacteria bacterium]
MIDNEQAVKTIFLLVFFLIYGGVHLYLFLGAKASLALETRTSIFVALFMLIMVLAPVIVHMSERNDFEAFAIFFSWAGYTWMGVAFLFFCLLLAFDCYRILAHLGAYIFSLDSSSVIPPARHCFITLLSLAAVLALYGYIEALHIRTETITIRTARIPEEIGRFRIVQISDLHLGLIVREKRLERILKEVRAAAPDILFSTGDLVDGQADNMSGLADLLRGINPEYGKFAVTGNHEFYAGLTQSIDFTERAGFRVLRGEGANVGGFINVAGVDDPPARIYGAIEAVPEEKLLSGFSDDRFTILLKHQPVVLKGSPALFDLQLSGHTHKGQIFPFTLVTRLFFAFNSGCYHLDEGSVLYVSRGTGTWGPPMRLMAPPEITIIDLVHGE